MITIAAITSAKGSTSSARSAYDGNEVDSESIELQMLLQAEPPNQIGHVAGEIERALLWCEAAKSDRPGPRQAMSEATDTRPDRAPDSKAMIRDRC